MGQDDKPHPSLGRWTRRLRSINLRRLLAERCSGGSCVEAGMTEGTTGKRAARHFLKRETAQARAYSQAVITEGGKTLWLAGQGGAADASGKSLAGDFDRQVREVFFPPDPTPPDAA